MKTRSSGSHDERLKKCMEKLRPKICYGYADCLAYASSNNCEASEDESCFTVGEVKNKYLGSKIC